ncbi:Imm49 family immunity protein [Nocardia sp. NPDC058058]|uniref:Imm49 family immunity protein n=1 Tax=Nocardia sp. NPDC058058 TaxID=3346317 RepID=UPI0036D977C1
MPRRCVPRRSPRKSFTSVPDIVTTIPRDYLDQIAYQPISLFHTLHRMDERAFNDTLAVALRHHRDYWTADSRRATGIEGHLGPRPAGPGPPSPGLRPRDRGGIRLPPTQPATARLASERRNHPPHSLI